MVEVLVLRRIVDKSLDPSLAALAYRLTPMGSYYLAITHFISLVHVPPSMHARSHRMCSVRRGTIACSAFDHAIGDVSRG